MKLPRKVTYLTRHQTVAAPSKPLESVFCSRHRFRKTVVSGKDCADLDGLRGEEQTDGLERRDLRADRRRRAPQPARQWETRGGGGNRVSERRTTQYREDSNMHCELPKARWKPVCATHVFTHFPPSINGFRDQAPAASPRGSSSACTCRARSSGTSPRAPS